MPFDRLSLSAKLLGSFGLVLSMALAMGLFALSQVAAINRQAADVSGRILPEVAQITDLDKRIAEYRMAQLAYTATSIDGEIDYGKIIDTNAKAVAGQFSALAATAGPGDEQQALEQAAALWRAYVEASASSRKLADRGQSTDAIEKLGGPVAAGFRKLTLALDRIAQAKSGMADAARAQSVGLYRRTLAAVIAAIVAMVAIGTVCGALIARRIGRQMGLATAALKAIAAGRLDQSIGQAGGDEIGAMLSDLTHMQAQLARTVARLRENAMSVADATREVASANGDLSMRTERQAAELERMNSVVQGINDKVRGNSENARRGDALAQGMQALALQGDSAMAALVDTMASVNDSTRTMAQAISVIEGFAAQTNILALNAAVESARAGTEGRGFAAIAEEVRSLAKRSSESAKDISALIQATGSRVAQASNAVGDARKVMTEMQDATRDVSTVMSEVHAACTEQARQIDTLSGTTRSIDLATQQNAALVEQMAATAAGMSQQAEDSAQALSFFQIPAALADPPSV